MDKSGFGDGCLPYYPMVFDLQYFRLGCRVYLYVYLQSKINQPGICKRSYLPYLRCGRTDGIFSAASGRPYLYLLYLMGCIIPTLLEYGTALLMLKIFGEVWWDYSQKPFNYKGILCLESTVAWGFYTLGLFLFLHKGVERVVESYSFQTGTRLGGILLLIFAVDFAYALYQKKKDCIPDSFQEFKEGILAFRWR